MTKEEYDTCRAYAANCRVEIPPQVQLERGGIVGVARLIDCTFADDSPWFVGPIGWMLEDARPVPMVPCPGQLGLFMAPSAVVDMVMRL